MLLYVPSKCQQSVKQILANGESAVAVLTGNAAILLKCERGDGATQYLEAWGLELFRLTDGRRRSP